VPGGDERGLDGIVGGDARLKERQADALIAMRRTRSGGDSAVAETSVRLTPVEGGPLEPLAI
jgi:hypothetical protein